MNQPFSPGIAVYYQEHLGDIRFVCADYVTVCISTGETKSKDVCVIVYPHQYKDIKLEKQSQK